MFNRWKSWRMLSWDFSFSLVSLSLFVSLFSDSSICVPLSSWFSLVTSFSPFICFIDLNNIMAESSYYFLLSGSNFYALVCMILWELLKLMGNWDVWLWPAYHYIMLLKNIEHAQDYSRYLPGSWDISLCFRTSFLSFFISFACLLICWVWSLHKLLLFGHFSILLKMSYVGRWRTSASNPKCWPVSSYYFSPTVSESTAISSAWGKDGGWTLNTFSIGFQFCGQPQWLP